MSAIDRLVSNYSRQMRLPWSSNISGKQRVWFAVYPPTEEVCRECHNAHSPFVGMDYKFDFDERVKRGTHEHFKLKYEHGK